MIFKLEKKILLSIFIVYLLLVLFVGFHHEPWFDEAQAWLIARDNSFLEIIKALYREGHPFNWYFIVKTFQLCGLSYDYFYLVSILFSSIGVYFFLFKTDFPILIKGLVPFSYPLFYQYAIVSRSYCLVFPTLMIYSYLYRKYRYSNPYFIIGTLIFLAGISLHTVVLSFVLLILYLIDLFQNKQISIKVYISVPFLIAFYYFTYWYLQIGERKPIFSILSFLQRDFFLYCTYIKSLFLAFDEPIIIGAILVIISMLVMFYSFFKSLYKSVLLVFGTLIFYLYFAAIKMNFWHTDLFLIFCIFLFSLYFKEEHKNILKNKLFYSIFAIILVISASYSFTTSRYDLNNKYDTAKQVAKILERSGSVNKKIYAYGFKTYSIQPYFNKNIFVNSEKSWWVWNKKMSSQIYTDIGLYNPHIILFSTHAHNQEVLFDYIEKNNIKYKKMCLNAGMYYKRYKNEDNGYCLLILNEE